MTSQLLNYRLLFIQSSLPGSAVSPYKRTLRNNHVASSIVFARWCQSAPHVVAQIGIGTVPVLPPAESLSVYRPPDMLKHVPVRPLPPLKTAPLHRDLHPHLIAAPLHTDLHPHLTMLPWAHPSAHPKQQLDRFSRFCRAH